MNYITITDGLVEEVAAASHASQTSLSWMSARPAVQELWRQTARASLEAMTQHLRYHPPFGPEALEFATDILDRKRLALSRAEQFLAQTKSDSRVASLNYESNLRASTQAVEIARSEMDRLLGRREG
jgi:hypothetical protein